MAPPAHLAQPVAESARPVDLAGLLAALGQPIVAELGQGGVSFGLGQAHLGTDGASLRAFGEVSREAAGAGLGFRPGWLGSGLGCRGGAGFDRIDQSGQLGVTGPLGGCRSDRTDWGSLVGG
ncbi:hypothetical protein VQ03_03350 [Methylobacterium tarhaniae]|uniref:Uncharacterized protein n=1 Tax=Methylobacterium tarhaniae TaxID=1187852 RepID=A0A0J6VYJ2_9HYPH|nr:hypothetical protein VQ03_03350 [Methylobacterium tarhaniae]